MSFVVRALTLECLLTSDRLHTEISNHHLCHETFNMELSTIPTTMHKFYYADKPIVQCFIVYIDVGQLIIQALAVVLRR